MSRREDLITLVFINSLVGHRVSRKKEVLFRARLMGLIAEKKEGGISPVAFLSCPVEEKEQ